MTAVEVLREARRLIQERGWVQGMFSGAGGAICAVGALNFASAGIVAYPARDSAEEHLNRCAKEYLRQVLPEDSITVEHWNDTPGRTVAEVLAYFDAAIARAEAQP